MSFKYMLNYSISLSKQVCWAWIFQVFLQSSRTWGNILFSQSRYVPYSDRWVQGGGHKQVFTGVECGAHYIVIVTSQNTDACPALPVPDPYGLIVGRGNYPRVLVVEHSGSDVIQMAQQGENATFLLVVPYLDFVIVSARHEQGLLVVETYSAYGAVVFVEFFKQCAHAIIPELDAAVVQTGQDPWPFWVEGKALDSGGFCFKFCQHFWMLNTHYIFNRKKQFIQVKLIKHRLSCWRFRGVSNVIRGRLCCSS